MENASFPPSADVCADLRTNNRLNSANRHTYCLPLLQNLILSRTRSRPTTLIEMAWLYSRICEIASRCGQETFTIDEICSQVLHQDSSYLEVGLLEYCGPRQTLRELICGFTSRGALTRTVPRQEVFAGTQCFIVPKRTTSADTTRAKDMQYLLSLIMSRHSYFQH